MNFFPEQPVLVKSDVARLLPYINNEHTTRTYLKTNPSRDEVGKCVLLEIERAKSKFSPLHVLNRGVLVTLRNYQARLEKQEFESRVLAYLNQP